MTLTREHTPNWGHGSAAAKIGTKEWADHVRLTMIALVQSLGKDDERLARKIEFIKKHRAWTLMNKRDHSCFTTIEEFCAYERPWGLGMPWPELRPFVVLGLVKRGMTEGEAERALQLETVAEPMAPTNQHTKSARGNDCPKQIPDRTAKQLRAINRAPEAIRDAYREGRISQTLAAKLGPKSPTPEQAAAAAAIAEQVREAKTRKEADAIARSAFGVAQKSTLTEKAIRLVERMQARERLDFAAAITPLLMDAEAEIRAKEPSK